MNNHIKPMVSVIIAAYNVEKYIEQCLNSLFSQTLDNIEVICVNDGSTDHTGEILKKYREKEKRLVTVFQDNQGAGTARNAGLNIAKGQYLSFLDGDDFFDRTLLEKCVNIMEKEKSDIVVYSANRWNMKTEKAEPFPDNILSDSIPTIRPFHPSEIREHIFDAFKSWAWNKMFRTSFIREKRIFFQEVSRTNDMAFVFSALIQASSISVINESLLWYRVGMDNNLQATNSKDPMAFWDAYIETKRRMTEINLYHEYEHSFLNYILRGCLYNMDAMNNTDARLFVCYLLRYEGEKRFGFCNHPKEYYTDQNMYEKYVNLLQQESILTNETEIKISALQEEILILKNQINTLQNSNAYKTGRLLMFVPHQIRMMVCKK